MARNDEDCLALRMAGRAQALMGHTTTSRACCLPRYSTRPAQQQVCSVMLTFSFINRS